MPILLTKNSHPPLTLHLDIMKKQILYELLCPLYTCGFAVLMWTIKYSDLSNQLYDSFLPWCLIIFEQVIMKLQNPTKDMHNVHVELTWFKRLSLSSDADTKISTSLALIVTKSADTKHHKVWLWLSQSLLTQNITKSGCVCHKVCWHKTSQRFAVIVT